MSLATMRIKVMHLRLNTYIIASHAKNSTRIFSIQRNMQNYDMGRNVVKWAAMWPKLFITFVVQARDRFRATRYSVTKLIGKLSLIS